MHKKTDTLADFSASGVSASQIEVIKPTHRERARLHAGRAIGFALALFASFTGMACSAAEDAPLGGNTRRSEPVATIPASLIGGTTTPDLRSVVKIGGCTGTVIGPRQVLTAGHCWLSTPIGAQVTVSDGTGTLQTTAVTAFTDNLFADVAIATTQHDLMAAPIPIYSEQFITTEWAGRSVLLVGFGPTTTNKDSKWVTINSFAPDGLGMSVGSGNIQGGDSGGPSLAMLNGRWYVVAVTKSDSDFVTRADAFANWARSLTPHRGDHVHSKRSGLDAPFKSDVTGDGKDDLVVTTSTGTTLYRATATGYDTPWSDSTLKLGYAETGLGDFNNDGKADLAVLTSAPSATAFRILLSTGSGFQTNEWFSNGWRMASVNLHLADFTGDGATDVLGLGNDTAFLFKSTGATLESWEWGIPRRLFESTATVADFNGDGRADVLLQTGSTVVNSNKMTLWTGTTTGTLVNTGWEYNNAGRGRLTIVAGRFVSSQGSDILLMDKAGTSLLTTLAPSNGFNPFPAWATTWTANNHIVTVGNFVNTPVTNRDDVIVTNASGSFLYKSTGNASAPFINPPDWNRADLTIMNTLLVPTNWNGDAHGDVWIINPTGTHLYRSTGTSLTASAWSASTLKLFSYIPR